MAGYALSSAVRPFMALAQSWTHVFTVRLVDRVGKGIRGAPRDALLAGWSSPGRRGRVYGFHRAMDHAGAVAGPLLASAFLFFQPGEYRTLFALTIVPGAVAVLLIPFVHEEPDAPAVHGAARGPRAAEDRGSPLGGLPTDLTRFMLVLTLFTLGNSTDAFLLLKLTDAAGGVTYLPLIWSAHHIVKASLSMVGGSLSDRIGRREVIAAGWVVFAIVYAGFAVATSLPVLIALFLLYGLYFGLVEGTEKALVADLAPASRRGFAFGVFTAVEGVGALAASVVFGIVWTAFGAPAAFGLGAVLALVATALLFAAVPRPARADAR
jgi:MFS family permease